MAWGSVHQRSQLQWMVLLAMAIVLPTVSLLWFMSRVVTNERLVIRQKMATLYQRQLEDAGEQVKRAVNERFFELDRANWALDPYGLLRRLVLKEHFQGVVVWSREGSLIYPSVRDSFLSGNLSLNGPLEDAWQLEFVEEDWAAAAAEYGRMAATAEDRSVGQAALAGQVRCLARLTQWSNATEAALSVSDTSGAPARQLLLTMMASDETGSNNDKLQLLHALEHDLFRSTNADFAPGPDFGETEDYLPSEENLLIARKLLEMLPSLDAPDMDQRTVRLQTLIRAEERSLAALRKYPAPAGPVNAPVPVQLNDERVYMHRYQSPHVEMMIVLSDEGLASELDGYRAQFNDSDARFRIFDGQGNQIAGDAGEGIPAIAAAPLPEGFPDGRVELFFPDGTIFDKTAGRQIAVYVWSGALVILLMLIVGAFAFKAVGRQIRLNRMKNDFIATVSHELKTPLASMRLLVDTLLEGRTRDEAHAEEYLQMIARENERLTRMIENFLSFSRMERNKNAFSLEPASPQAIAEDAADCVCTKYRSNHCRLETDLAADLPDIHADHDAMVTVLINLLDNACKYTTDDKEIRLAVFAEADEVCFAVSDHGIGLTNRQIRRIFDSFYQVDNSLARTREGCGLGLSIVQFIVSAHKGHIEVESEPGKGTTFTVRLPINRKNGSKTNI